MLYGGTHDKGATAQLHKSHKRLQYKAYALGYIFFCIMGLDTDFMTINYSGSQTSLCGNGERL